MCVCVCFNINNNKKIGCVCRSTKTEHFSFGLKLLSFFFFFFVRDLFARLQCLLLLLLLVVIIKWRPIEVSQVKPDGNFLPLLFSIVLQRRGHVLNKKERKKERMEPNDHNLNECVSSHTCAFGILGWCPIPNSANLCVHFQGGSVKLYDLCTFVSFIRLFICKFFPSFSLSLSLSLSLSP